MRRKLLIISFCLIPTAVVLAGKYAYVPKPPKVVEYEGNLNINNPNDLPVYHRLEDPHVMGKPDPRALVKFAKHKTNKAGSGPPPIISIPDGCVKYTSAFLMKNTRAVECKVEVVERLKDKINVVDHYFTIIFPKSYNFGSKRNFPYAIWLHGGAPAYKNHWSEFIHVDQLLAKVAKEAGEVMLIAPRIRIHQEEGFRSPMYYRYFCWQLPQFIEKNFISGPKNRALVGWSSGGSISAEFVAVCPDRFTLISAIGGNNFIPHLARAMKKDKFVKRASNGKLTVLFHTSPNEKPHIKAYHAQALPAFLNSKDAELIKVNRKTLSPLPNFYKGSGDEVSIFIEDKLPYGHSWSRFLPPSLEMALKVQVMTFKKGIHK